MTLGCKEMALYKKGHNGTEEVVKSDVNKKQEVKKDKFKTVIYTWYNIKGEL